MRKHLRTTAFIVLLAFVGLPLSIEALTAENLPPHDSGCDCFECEIERENSGPEPVYQHASDCPCNECVAKRESPSANNETSFEDVIDSFGGLMPPYNPIDTTWDYLTERWDDFWSSIKNSDTPNYYGDYYGNGYYQ